MNKPDIGMSQVARLPWGIICEIVGPDIGKSLQRSEEVKELICYVWNSTSDMRECEALRESR